MSKSGCMYLCRFSDRLLKASYWDQVGPSGTKRDQAGPSGTKWGRSQTGPNGAKQGPKRQNGAKQRQNVQIGPNGAKQDQSGSNWAYFYERMF